MAAQLLLFPEPTPAPDAAEAMPTLAPRRVERGDLWQLGAHRLLCGDATRAHAWLLRGVRPDIIFADPPYGVRERTKRHSSKRDNLTRCYDFPAIVGDDKAFDPTWLLKVRANVRILWGANYYATRLPERSSWLVWDKRDGLASNDNADCEIAWTDAKGPARIFRHRWSGMIKASEKTERRCHPTQKPVALAVWCFERYGKAGGVVFDPYAGSGISILAAERTKRTCYAVEIEPHYCDIILRRWEQMTGQRAVLIDRAGDVRHASQTA